jgi:cyclopropane fatty-acyl-phospholipid synthase-like methyltransferase
MNGDVTKGTATDQGSGATWDKRYASQGWSRVPDPSLVEKVAPLPPGRALDLGCGTGRNSLWLARQGWAVRGIDSSRVGLQMAADQAAQEDLRITTEQVDLATFQPTPGYYDLVVIANIHLAPELRDVVFDRAAAAVAAGGYMYIIGHHVDALGRSGPPSRERLFEESLFRSRFDGFTVLTLERRETASDDDEMPDVSLLLWAMKNGGADGVEQ